MCHNDFQTEFQLESFLHMNERFIVDCLQEGKKIQMLNQFFEHVALKYGIGAENFVRANKLWAFYETWKNRPPEEDAVHRLRPENRFHKIAKGGKPEKKPIPFSERKPEVPKVEEPKPDKGPGMRETQPAGPKPGVSQPRRPEGVLASPKPPQNPQAPVPGNSKPDPYFSNPYQYFPEYLAAYPGAFHSYYPPPAAPTMDAAYWQDPKAPQPYLPYPPSSQYPAHPEYPPFTYPPNPYPEAQSGQANPPMQVPYYPYPYPYHYPWQPPFPSHPAAPTPSTDRKDARQPVQGQTQPTHPPPPSYTRSMPPPPLYHPSYPPYSDPYQPKDSQRPAQRDQTDFPRAPDPGRNQSVEPSEPSLTSANKHRGSHSPTKHRVPPKSQKMSRIDDLFSKLVP